MYPSFFRLLFFVCLFLCITHSLFAQFGLKGGANYSTLQFNTPDEIDVGDFIAAFSWKGGGYLGAYYQKEWSKKHASTVELLITQKGLESIDFQVHLIYLSLPLMAYYFPSENFAFGLGTEIGYLFARTTNRWDLTTDELLRESYDQNLDISLNAGIKFKIIERLWLEGRFNLGIIPVQELEFTDANGQAAGIVNSYNRNFQVGVTYELKSQQ